MNALCWLAENVMIIWEVTNKIQQIAVHKNYEIPVNMAKSEGEEVNPYP